MTAAVWAAVPLLAIVAVEDLRYRRIRNRHVLSLAVVTAVAVVVLAIDEGGHIVLRAVLGAAVAAVPLLVAAIAEPERMGGGDVKLAAVVGALLGTLNPWASLAAIACALVLALAATTLRAASRVPLAPVLVVTAVTALVLLAAL